MSHYAPALKHLLIGQDLDEDTAGHLLEELLGGALGPGRSAAALTALAAKGENAIEIAAFAQAIRRHARSVRATGLVFDSSGDALPGHKGFITTTQWGWSPSLPPGSPTWDTNFASFYIVLFGSETCAADFNGDGFIDFTDFDDFVFAFEGGDPAGDFNGDGFLDFTDFDEFVGTFEAGC